VRHVRGRDLHDPAGKPGAAEVDDVAILRRSRCSGRLIVERQHAAEFPVRYLRIRRRGEELVHRAALVGLDVREGDPAQLLDRQHLGDRLAHARDSRRMPVW
jgi:hypothetical protein